MLSTVTQQPTTVKADTLVVFTKGGTEDPKAIVPKGCLTPAQRRALTSAVSKSKKGPATAVSPAGFAAKWLVFARCAATDSESIRRAAGEAVRDSPGNKIAILPPDWSGESVRATLEGAILGNYTFTSYKSKAAETRQLVLVVDEPRKDEVARWEALANGAAWTRDLVNTPPNHLWPQALAEEAAELAELPHTEVEVWKRKQLTQERCGGILAVGMGSAKPPRLVQIKYTHPQATKTVCLVGKGITFDSGGLSLKPPKAMETMKSDMGGAAAVLAVAKVVAKWRLPVNVTTYLCCAENMPDGGAQRPSDVIEIRNGKTVEVLNTDAEGRLVLADGLCLAAESNPDEIIDVATLTGAQAVALGSRVAGLMGNNEELQSELQTAAAQAGEDIWPMPLPAELRAGLDSQVADIANVGDRNGGMLSAAIFLQEFVPNTTPWAHLDIAGPSFNSGSPHGYTPKGGTGFAVRLLVQHLANLAAATEGSNK